MSVSYYKARPLFDSLQNTLTSIPGADGLETLSRMLSRVAKSAAYITLPVTFAVFSILTSAALR